ERVGEGLEAGGERQNRPDVEIAVRPAVETMANARRERIVDARMAKGTLNAHRLQSATAVEETCHADNGIQFEQRERRGGIVEVDFSVFDLLLQRGRQRVRVDFEPHRQRHFRTNAAAYTAVLGAGDGLVKLQAI